MFWEREELHDLVGMTSKTLNCYFSFLIAIVFPGFVSKNQARNNDYGKLVKNLDLLLSAC